jgi:trehalose 6-phosphate synthase
VSRLVVVSNRVAVPKARGATGAQGGLTGALQAALQASGGLWFGWSGKECEDECPPELVERDGVTTATIPLAQQDVDEYYNGYANSTLWPLFHYRIDLAEYDRETGRGYERVNELFADRLHPLLDPDDTIWIHDYHLVPLGERLRERGCGNRMGFFLHIPWPPTRLFVSLPYHERLVRTMLHYDLVGFQCDEWLESFLHYCRKELGARVDETSGRIVLDGEVTYARAYPIGIDYDHFTAQGKTEAASDAYRRLVSSSRGRSTIIGVDRLDYSKGLPERIDGLARLFERYPECVRELLFVQIAPPSREDVESYQQIRETLEQKTGRVNGEYSEIDLVPIRYVNKGHSTAELYGIYRAAQIGLVTPLRDGMNLVAKEYVAAQDPGDPGVLILSRFAGAAQQLREALLVNPHSPDEVADAIRTALAMSPAERRRRHGELLESVRTDTVQRWTSRFLEDLAGVDRRALERID